MSKTTKNSGKAWTPSDKQQLRHLASGNTPTRIIALKMKRTPDAIYNQAAKQHTPLKPTNQRPYGTAKKR